MKQRKSATGGARELRHKVRGQVLVRSNSLVTSTMDMPPDNQRLIQELQIHQIELEQQNEELHRARTEAEDERSRYSDLYELAPVGYITLGHDGAIQEINLVGARLLRLERSRLIGSRLALMVATECLPHFNDLLTGVFEHRTNQTCEVVLQPAAAPPLTVELVATASEDGHVCRVSVMDITQRRQAEQERADLQLQLAQAQKMEAIGTLAGGIAHDFNNILTGILGGLSLLDLDLGETSEQHAEIQEMIGLVKRASDLTKQLLGFARRGRYVVAPLDLADVLRKTSTMFGRTRKDITIRTDVAPGLRAVLMDHAQLEQVLLNLCINAAYAMPDGGNLRLCAENAQISDGQETPPGALPGCFVKLEVTDTGIGMDAATQARIFEPFFTTKGIGAGSGLGLASTYGIIKGHGGFITVKSAVGSGSTFTLLLPATDRQVAEEEVSTATIQHGAGTILVVDDEEQILRINARLLERIGYDVITASSGRQAIDLFLLHRGKISLVILDMIMPDMGGRQTYDALEEILPDVKVLLCSGYSSDGHAQEMMARGCKGFIQKPFDAAALSTKLKELL
ncbi:MAG TPA: response regulator [Polyangiaceae bacterium]|nr:response regulator [Polyangiaceae bacterium]